MTAKSLVEALERFDSAQLAEAEERSEQLDDLRFRALQQWPEALKRMRESDINGARPCLVLDQVGQRCRQVVNDTRQNLPSIRVRPVDDRADKDTADVINGLIRHIEDVSSANMAYLTALDWSVTCGLGYFRILTEYTSDDSWDQDIRIARVHNRFAVYRDPYSTALDGADMEWCFITDDVPRKALKKMHPKAEMPSDFASGSEGDMVRGWFGEDTVRIAEYFRIERKKDEVVLLEDQSTMYGSRYQEVLSEGVVLLPVIRSRPVDRRACKWQKITGCEVLEESEFPSSFIPVIPVIGTEFWIDGKRQLSGLVRPAKDPQRGLNYHCSVATEVMALQPRAPYIGAEGQFEGHPEWDSANSENYSKLQYNPISLNGVSVGAPQRQQMAGAPSGLLQMMQMFAGQISMATGMHEASFGAPSNETSGIAIRERKEKGDVGTAHYRGNLGFSMMQAGRILIEVTARVYDTARVARIIGEDGVIDTVSLEPGLGGPSEITPKGQPNRHDITIGKYDISIDIGPAFATRRQDAAAAMIEMARVDQALMPTAGDLVYRQMDWPGAEQLADRRKKGLPPEFQDEEGEEPQIPPQVKAQIDQAMQQYEEQLGQAQQMIEGLQQQLGEASQAAEEGQAAAMDKRGDREIKARELALKEFQAQMEVQESQAAEQAKGADREIKARELALKEFQATQAVEISRFEAEGKRIEAQLAADVAMAAAPAEGGQMEQVLCELAERVQTSQDHLAAMIQALAARQPIVVNVQKSGPMARVPIRDQDGNIVRVIEQEMMEADTCS